MAISTTTTSTNPISLVDELEQFVIDETNEFIEDLYDRTKAATPVKTGNAQAGWEKVLINSVGDEGAVGNPVEYVSELEDGTAKMAPRKFVETSIIRTLNERK